MCAIIDFQQLIWHVWQTCSSLSASILLVSVSTERFVGLASSILLKLCQLISDGLSLGLVQWQKVRCNTFHHRATGEEESVYQAFTKTIHMQWLTCAHNQPQLPDKWTHSSAGRGWIQWTARGTPSIGNSFEASAEMTWFDVTWSEWVSKQRVD